jgi:hypothetical protein
MGDATAWITSTRQPIAAQQRLAIETIKGSSNLHSWDVNPKKVEELHIAGPKVQAFLS